MSDARFSFGRAVPLIQPDELVQLLGLRTRKALYSRIRRGTVPPPIRVGSSLRWCPAQVAQWIAERSEGVRP